jgi:chain length determinant protein EpsF
MSLMQCLVIVWVRKWLVLAIFLVIAVVGVWYAVSQPRLFTAESLLVLDVRPDPVLGGLASASSMATQLEILRTAKVATRVYEILKLGQNPESVEHWKTSTSGKMPIEAYYVGMLQRGLAVDALRGSNLIEIAYGADDETFAIAAANAYANAAVDVTLELRVGPTRESAEWFAAQTKVLRSNLEAAQARLSAFQRETGIVVSDERLGQEVSRLNALEVALVSAQAERLDASGRQRSAANENTNEAQRSGMVPVLQAQLAAAEAKLADISTVLGSGHPQRVQLEGQIGVLRQQLSTELARVAVGSAVVSRVSSQKVDELRAMVDAQKRQVLSLRAQRDQISVLLTDIATAQRAYDGASQRAGQLTLESQSNQTSVRVLSPATEATDASRRKLILRILASLAAGLAAGAAVAVGLELLDRRVRSEDDLLAVADVPIFAVLHPNDGRRSIFRRLGASVGRRPSPMLPPMGHRS